ncbi:MAG: hypothetical protein SV253_05260, partial [Halobacteria archaeon]|nr:hypothetical protein [Halobacteria archaeon]
TSALNEVSQNASQLSDRAESLRSLMDDFELRDETSGSETVSETEGTEFGSDVAADGGEGS